MQARPGRSQWRSSRNLGISSLGIPTSRLVRALDALVGTQSLTEICCVSGPLRVIARSTDAVDRAARAHASNQAENSVVVAAMLPPRTITLNIVAISLWFRCFSNAVVAMFLLLFLINPSIIAGKNRVGRIQWRAGRNFGISSLGTARPKSVL
jgi:hypothetical protein